MCIAVIEQEYHWNVLNGLCHLFRQAGYQVTVYTTKKNFQRIEGQVYVSDFEFRLRNSHEGLLSFLRKHLIEINTHEVVVLNTCADYIYAYCKVDFEPMVLWRVHNVNSDFRPFSSFLFPKTPLRVYKTLTYSLRHLIWRKDWYYKKVLLDRVDWVSFLDFGVTEFVKEHGLAPFDKIGATIPFVLAPDAYPEDVNAKKKITFAIPGIQINQSRKDFQVVFDALNTMEDEVLKNVELVLFGPAVDAKSVNLLRNFKKLENRDLTLVHVENVHQSIFDEKMEACDVILAPLKIATRHTVYREFYGQTKLSGAVADMVKYGKPIIFPQGLNIHPDLRPYVDFFSDQATMRNAIKAFLGQDYSRGEQIDNLRKKLSEIYSVEKFRNSFQKMVEK